MGQVIMSDIIGVTCPVHKKYITRFFDEGKTVFIKPGSIFKEIHEGMKFVFYQSREDVGYIGEARIKGITFAKNPLSFFETYGDSIFLTQEEVKEYARTRGSKMWIAIELENLQKYDTPREPYRYVPISGRYLRSDKV